MKKLIIFLFLGSLFMYPVNGFSVENPVQLPWFRDLSFFQIHVKTLTGKMTTLEVNPATTIEQVKMKLMEKDGYSSIYIMRLIFGGRVLEDIRTLADYNVQSESVMHLIIEF